MSVRSKTIDSVAKFFMRLGVAFLRGVADTEPRPTQGCNPRCAPGCWHRQVGSECPKCPHLSLDHGAFGCKIAGCPCQLVPAGGVKDKSCDSCPHLEVAEHDDEGRCSRCFCLMRTPRRPMVGQR